MPRSLAGLRLSLALGPVAAARTISRVLASYSPSAHAIEGSASWLAEIYASSLSAPQRSIMRDAVVVALRRSRGSELPRDTYLLVSLLALATEVQLLQVAPRSAEERLWATTVKWAREGSIVSAAHLLGYIAAEGPPASIEKWEQGFELIGDLATVGCAVGIAKSDGIAEAVDWIRTNASTESGDAAMVALLPRWVETDAEVIESLLASPEDPVFVARVVRIIDDLELAIRRPGDDSDSADLDIPSELLDAAIEALATLGGHLEDEDEGEPGGDAFALEESGSNQLSEDDEWITGLDETTIVDSETLAATDLIDQLPRDFLWSSLITDEAA